MRGPTLSLILTLLLVSCAREKAQVKAAVPVKPAEQSESESSAPRVATSHDDTQDLARQLRDPDLLNQLDEPTPTPLPRSGTGVSARKPFVIKGVESTPAPLPDSRPVPKPPIGKPEVPGSNDTGSPKSPGSGN